ncbi:MAG: TolB family protein [Bacteroidota bacterium]
MKSRFRPLLAMVILVFASLACVSVLGGKGDQTPSSDAVSTAVALTLQAVTPVAGVQTTPPPVKQTLLPHSLYFLASDDAGVTQVFRFEQDGQTRKQVTSEPGNVGRFGVSPVDGSVAYVLNNQLILVNADGSGRRVLVDGGAEDAINPFLNRIHNPVFSPDGQTLAYGYKGLNFYSLPAGTNTLAIKDRVKDMGNGTIFPSELYWPEKYSPDGSKLMITLGYYEGAEAAFYDPQSKSLVRLEAAPGALICCDGALWSADGTRVYSGNAAAGMFNPGLWQVDTTSGAVTTLLASDYDTNTFNLAKYPYLATDHQLYYFFLKSSTGEYSRTPLQLVRSAPDGVTGQTLLRDETFERMTEALWAPDASFVIVANATTEQMYQGGQAQIVYLDGRPDRKLVDFAQQMRWGP